MSPGEGRPRELEPMDDFDCIVEQLLLDLLADAQKVGFLMRALVAGRSPDALVQRDGKQCEAAL